MSNYGDYLLCIFTLVNHVGFQSSPQAPDITFQIDHFRRQHGAMLYAEDHGDTFWLSSRGQVFGIELSSPQDGGARVCQNSD